jgi:hypothetical protein
VAEMASEVLAPQAKTRADRTEEAFEEALEALMGTEERANTLRWSSSDEVPGSPVGRPRQGFR